MAQKIAITISGAVSLGSYEAGVLFELIQAIHLNNSSTSDDNKKIEIDVLTGASAGGMTAAITAQKLLFEASSLKDPYKNALYQAWVKDVSFDVLFNLDPTEDPTKSILSSNYVESISKKFLTDRYSNAAPNQKEKHPAVANTIHIGLALTNLNGLDYELPIADGSKFCYTHYQDQLVAQFNVDENTDDTLTPWEIVRNASIACGAFPFAFRTKELVRNIGEYQTNTASQQGVPLNSFDGQITQSFLYTDAGTFQNEPLGLAKNLVDKIDPVHADFKQRFYFFVSPRARSGTANSKINNSNADFVMTAQAIAEAIFNEARFQDWIRAEEVNHQIDVLDTRANQLCDALSKGYIKGETLKSGTDALLSLLFLASDELVSAQKRLKQQYSVQYQKLQKIGIATADQWIDAVLVLEKAADLGDKDLMTIFGVTASESELAGGGLDGFLGFFDQKYRDHDYDVGRFKAREVIRQASSRGLTFINYPASDAAIPTDSSWMAIRPIDPNLGGLKLTQVSEELRIEFRKRLSDRIDDVFKELKLKWFERMPLDILIVKRQLDKWLALS